GEQLVDRELRSDVDTARRLVGDDQSGPAEQRGRQEPLLLVPARQLADGLAVAPRPDVAAPEDLVRDASLATPRHEAEAAQPPEAREARILEDRTVENEALVLARFRDQRDTGAETRARAARQRRRVHFDDAAVRCGHADYRMGDLRSSGSDEPGQADDLAGGAREVDARPD